MSTPTFLIYIASNNQSPLPTSLAQQLENNCDILRNLLLTFTLERTQHINQTSPNSKFAP